jgi:hypothetical protein
MMKLTNPGMLLLTKTIFAAIGVWLLALLLLFVFAHLIPVVPGFAVLLSLPLAVILIILTLISLVKEKKKSWPAVAGALIVAVFFFVLLRVMYWGALVHICLHKRTYDTIAQRMLAAQDDAERRTICGEQCWQVSSDHGPIAFRVIGIWDTSAIDPELNRTG